MIFLDNVLEIFDGAIELGEIGSVSLADTSDHAYDVSPRDKSESELVPRFWEPLCLPSILFAQQTVVTQQQYMSWLRKQYLAGRKSLIRERIDKIRSYHTYDYRWLSQSESVYYALLCFGELMREGWQIKLYCRCDSEYCHAHMLVQAISGVAERL
jgi:hypothetical protein